MLNNSLEWKLVGSVNGNENITLPTNYKEIKLSTIYKNTNTKGGFINYVCNKEDIDNCTFDTIVTGNGYYMSTVNMVNQQVNINKNTNTIQCVQFYWANKGVVNNTISYLYYR